METDRTLSEIARSVLGSTSETDPRSLREKAGLLALLNLLGIVESFYCETGNVGSSINVIRSLAESPTVPAPQEQAREPDLASSLVSLASKFLSPSQGQGGIDPALIGTLLGTVMAMSKARGLSSRPAGGSESGPASGGDQGSEERKACAEEDKTAEGQEEPKSEDTPKEAPKPSPPSALQQILGIDPRLITLALNVLADFMKAKNAAAPDKQGSGPSNARGSNQETSGTPTSGREATGSAEVTLTPDGKSVLIPSARKHPHERLYHKPGLGIYRQRVDKAESAAE